MANKTGPEIIWIRPAHIICITTRIFCRSGTYRYKQSGVILASCLPLSSQVVQLNLSNWITIHEGGDIREKDFLNDFVRLPADCLFGTSGAKNSPHASGTGEMPCLRDVRSEVPELGRVNNLQGFHFGLF